MTKQYQYKIIGSSNGFPELEQKISSMLNDGWKPIGGIAFNQGHPYQAMAKLVDTKNVKQIPTQTTNKKLPSNRTFNEAIKTLEDLT